MMRFFTRNWWMPVLQGSLAIFLGITAIIWPDVTTQLLLNLFGIYLVLTGIPSAYGAIKYRERHPNWTINFLGNLVNVVMGIVCLVWTNFTSLAIVTMIGIWAIGSGILGFTNAIALRRVLVGEWRMMLRSTLSIIFGTIIIFLPGLSSILLVYLIAAYALFVGVILIDFGISLHKRDKLINGNIEFNV